MKKPWLSIAMGGILFLFPAVCDASNIVAIYAPNLDFRDGAERNAYVTKIAKVLEDATDMAWEGRAFARAADFEAEKGLVDVVIVDADYFSSKGGMLKPVGMLSSNGQTMKPLKLIAKKGGSDRLYDYRGKKLAVIANSSLAVSFVTSSVLGNEINASEYFSSIDEVRDVRSAMNAVEMGKADLTMVFDGYDKDFTTVYTSSAVALPIIAISGARLTETQQEAVRAALLDIHIQGAYLITATSTYKATDASAYKRIAGMKKSNSLSYQPLTTEDVKINLSTSQLLEKKEGIVFNPFQVQYIPTLQELDSQLDQRL